MNLAIKLKFQSKNWILKNEVPIVLWPNNTQFNNGCCWPLWKLCWHCLQASWFNSVLWKLGWKTLAVPSVDPMAAQRHRLLHISAANFCTSCNHLCTFRMFEYFWAICLKLFSSYASCFCHYIAVTLCTIILAISQWYWDTSHSKEVIYKLYMHLVCLCNVLAYLLSL